MARILVFGGSGSYGARDKEGGWVQRLRKFSDEKTLPKKHVFHLFYNLSISANTTEDLLGRFESETKQRKEKNMIIIFAIGINDSRFLYSKNSLWTPQERFKENIQKLINLGQKFTQKIIFIGLTPVDESKTIPIPWKKDESYKNEYIQKYDHIIKEICEKNKIHFIEIFDKFIKSDLSEDGLHPNSDGHQKIFEIVKDFLIKNKII